MSRGSEPRERAIDTPGVEAMLYGLRRCTANLSVHPTKVAVALVTTTVFSTPWSLVLISALSLEGY